MRQVARSRALSFQIMERHGGRPSATAVVEIIVVFEKTRSRPGLGRFSQKITIICCQSVCATLDQVHSISD